MAFFLVACQLKRVAAASAGSTSAQSPLLLLLSTHSLAQPPIKIINIKLCVLYLSMYHKCLCLNHTFIGSGSTGVSKGIYGVSVSGRIQRLRMGCVADRALTLIAIYNDRHTDTVLRNYFWEPDFGGDKRGQLCFCHGLCGHTCESNFSG